MIAPAATVSSRPLSRVAIAILIAAAIALAVYLALRPVCESGGRARRGDARRDANGRWMYFDGRCWSTKPMPPGDQPF